MVGDFKRCTRCQEFGWSDSHTCPPMWEARLFTKQGNEEWSEVYANDVEAAASKFCENHDQYGEYDIGRRGHAEVEVRKSEDDKITLVDVEAETVPHYYGHERKSSDKSDAA